MGTGYYVGWPGYVASPAYPVDPLATATILREPYGYLRLLVQPAAAEVYVDGYYVGTAAEFNTSSSGRPLEPGPHRVEIRADGFQPALFDVRISPAVSISYRKALEPAEPPPPPTRAVSEPRTPGPTRFYMIPGCYAGNRPPRADWLPAGCDPARVRTLPD
jgi:hypothetical protein